MHALALADLTVTSARRVLANALRTAGIDSPEVDARVLIGHVLGLDHAVLAAEGDRLLTAEDAQHIGQLAERRLAHEPVARIIGYKEFWDLKLRVNEGTLVPRPETETVVEATLAALDTDGPRSRPLRILDIGTGTGALLLALLHELPTSSGIGTDIDQRALTAAHQNACELGLESRCAFLACNFADAVAGPFDVVVSNPPYIPSGDIAGLEPDVRDYEPRHALDGGKDGLDAYRAIALDAARVLAPGGHMVVELGVGQDTAVADVMTAAGLMVQSTQQDLAGIVRALHAQKPV